MANPAGQGRPGCECSSLVVTALALVLCAVVSCGPALGGDTSRLEPLIASGTLEAESVSLYPEIGGRVVELGVSEGQELQAGALIAQLDDAIWRAQLAQAEAALISARAQLAHLEAGSRPEVVTSAQAELKEAQAERDRAYRAWQYAILMRDDPQQLTAQIVAAQAELAVAEQEIVQQEAQLSQRTVSRDRYHYPQREWHFLNFLTTAAQEALEAARVKRNGAAAHLANLVDMRDRPLALNAEAHAAQAQYLVAEAEVLQKEAALQAIQAGSGQRELEVARAQVALSAARVRTAEVYLAQTTIVAPLSGVVSDLSLHRGELASPAAPLAVLSNPERMTLRVYVPERSLSRVYLGQEVRVRVDAYPGQTFQGNVTFISSEAEFAPRSITSQEGRARMMFAVDIRVPNGDDLAQGSRRRLKPGLPADAEFIEERNTL